MNPFRTFRLATLAGLLGCAGLIGLAAQPPREEEDPKSTVKKKIVVEDEDPKGTVKKKVVVDDPATGKKGREGPAGSTPDVRLDELAKAAEEAHTPALKSVFAKYAVPFDRVGESGGTPRVKPIPFRKSEWPAGQEAVSITPLDAAGKAKETRSAAVKDVKSVDHFESMILVDADALAKEKLEGIARLDNLAAAEKLLAAGVRFHDFARERNLRRGKGWDDIRTPLAAKLRDIRLDALRAALAATDPIRVRESSAKLMEAYPNDAAVAQAVGVARIGEADRLAKSDSHTDHLRAKNLLDEFDAKFPGAGGDAGRKVRAQLREIASAAFTRAKDKQAVGDLTTARDELSRAAALDPAIDGVRDMQRELRSGYPILYVGVRQFPTNLSPATARLDSEKQAVELVFEGLLEEVPEESGAVRYRPGAAVAMPIAVAGGRDFNLRTFDRDEFGRPGFDSHDVVGTVKLLRSRPDLWASYPLAWLAPEPPAPKDSSGVRIQFGLAHPDPRAALTFKLLPTKWMTENGRAVDDPGLAEKPFGTGPFKLHANPRPDGDNPREMVFVDNPAYGRWRDRTGQPQLREIRLIEVAKLDPVAAFRDDKLDILTDIPTAEIDRFTGSTSGLGSKVQVVTAAVNRRVHVLAVNLHRPGLQQKALRQGLSMAIDREEILRDAFRAGRPDFHKPMTGPFPPGSWAAPKGQSAPALLNRDLAVARLKTYLTDPGAKSEFTLSYPDDDPPAAAACAKIKSQIEGLSKDAARKLVINLDAVPMRELIVRVQDEHRYDLAYIPFDYPDDWHPLALGAALDPTAAGRGGRNWFGFLARETSPDAEDQRLGQVLNELRFYRDPAGQLAPRATEAARLFNDCLPFIPLWQLDRHTVVSNRLKVFVDDTPDPVGARLLNPTTLFQGVSRWRLE